MYFHDTHSAGTLIAPIVKNAIGLELFSLMNRYRMAPFFLNMLYRGSYQEPKWCQQEEKPLSLFKEVAYGTDGPHVFQNARANKFPFHRMTKKDQMLCRI